MGFLCRALTWVTARTDISNCALPAGLGRGLLWEAEAETAKAGGDVKALQEAAETREARCDPAAAQHLHGHAPANDDARAASRLPDPSSACSQSASAGQADYGQS